MRFQVVLVAAPLFAFPLASFCCLTPKGAGMPTIHPHLLEESQKSAPVHPAELNLRQLQVLTVIASYSGRNIDSPLISFLHRE